VSLPLNAWSRCSEITADRAGLICCRDLRVAQLALLKIIGGFTNIEALDIDLYLRQSKSTLSFHNIGKYTELFSTHPLIFKRIEALRLFYNSEMYHRITGESKGDKKLISDVELNKRTTEIIKVL
jgi:Zn-dependent protease with chaperone function